MTGILSPESEQYLGSESAGKVASHSCRCQKQVRSSSSEDERHLDFCSEVAALEVRRIFCSHSSRYLSKAACRAIHCRRHV